ncbi:MAG TPA: CmcI family methyltransferase [Candidatus Gastranaerophilales bacterium]|nr:CmcI family methyltransferase [Candidatus Gastranaerophilales bacterium]
MLINIDTEKKKLSYQIDDKTIEIELYSKEAFELISEQWVKTGWSQKYSYTFSWFGRPVIQLPEDMIRIQEVIYNIKPDVIVETGIAHGGSLIFYASLFKSMGKGRVIGVDIEIRPYNRKAIEEHELFEYITMVEGSSIDKSTFEQVKSLIKPEEKVLVILDSCHTGEHVLNELNLYSELVSKDSYIVATDGVMKNLYDVPGGHLDWKTSNPTQAAIDFVEKNNNFMIEQPAWSFNESNLDKNITHWPGAYLRRIK